MQKELDFINGIIGKESIENSELYSICKDFWPGFDLLERKITEVIENESMCFDCKKNRLDTLYKLLCKKKSNFAHKILEFVHTNFRVS